MKIEITYSPSQEEISVIYGGLVEFNAPHFPDLKEKKIASFVRNGDGEIIGGLSGVILFTSLYLNYFWLSESIRLLGYGSKLLAALELEAANDGLKNIFVDTYSFQAPVFYEKCGFKEVGRYANYPKEGVDKIFYAKQLDRA
ncbi:MAG TPA: GNAT family N-acetyltransferase [Candidatus Acidoferrum sp.]|nr:GNAT family N-acetyltransferase [Candidatus Acidoferrum sp.]